MEYQLDHMSWEHFCALITKIFAKNQHQMLLRQLFHIRQSSSMSVYIDEFSQLVDQLNAYQRMSDPLYYTMKFVDGLKDDIKAVVMLQRPKDFNIAAVLAQLQEEAGEMVKKRDYRKASTGFLSSTSPFGLAVQSQQQGSKDYQSSYHMKPDDKKTLGSSTNSLTSLYAYRKAQVLCYKCGLEYTKGHKCADMVQLQMVEELWQMVTLPAEQETALSVDEAYTECHSMLLSQDAIEGSSPPCTMRFVGHVEGLDVLILIDSGSSHSFISAALASTMSGVIALSSSVKVQVANGSQICCSSEIVGASWSMGGLSFKAIIKVLPLSTYDVIIGMDWLAAHSPMMVHWLQKWMIIPYQGAYVAL